MSKKPYLSIRDRLKLSKNITRKEKKIYVNYLGNNVKSKNSLTNYDIGCPSKLFFEDTVMKYSFNWREGGQFSKKIKDWLKNMIILIYILIIVILIFVISIGLKAAAIGIDAKKRRNINKTKKRKKSFSNEISRLNKLYKSGVINKKEFNIAKEKILKN